MTRALETTYMKQRILFVVLIVLRFICVLWKLVGWRQKQNYWSMLRVTKWLICMTWVWVIVLFELFFPLLLFVTLYCLLVIYWIAIDTTYMCWDHSIFPKWEFQWYQVRVNSWMAKEVPELSDTLRIASLYQKELVNLLLVCLW